MPRLSLRCGSPAGSSAVHFNRDDVTHKRMTALRTTANGGIVQGRTSFIRNPLPRQRYRARPRVPPTAAHDADDRPDGKRLARPFKDGFRTATRPTTPGQRYSAGPAWR